MQLLSTQSAAEILGHKSKTQVLRLIKSGQLKAQKVGRSLVIDLADLEDYMQHRRKPGRPRKAKPG